VDYGLKNYAQETAHPCQKPARVARFHQRSLEHKRELAAQVDDNEMLISAIRFYVARLRANRPTPAAPIRAIERAQSSRFCSHLRAVRRVLCIGYFHAGTRSRRKSRFLELDVMTMPGSYRSKLEAIGFDPWSDPDEFADFESLNANLKLDLDTAAFGRRYPILENVRRLLLGSAPVHLKPDPSQPPPKSNYPHDQMSAIIQNKIKVSMDEGREIRENPGM
jgi:hypothetical protein